MSRQAREKERRLLLHAFGVFAGVLLLALLLTAYLEQAIQESEDAWKLATREFTDGWRKVSNPKSRHPAVVETLKNNNRLTRKVKAAKARHERWVKIKALWADTAL